MNCKSCALRKVFRKVLRKYLFWDDKVMCQDPLCPKPRLREVTFVLDCLGRIFWSSISPGTLESIRRGVALEIPGGGTMPVNNFGGTNAASFICRLGASLESV